MMYYTLHKYRQKLIGLNRATAVQPTPATADMSDISETRYAQARELVKKYKRAWAIQNQVKAIMPLIKDLDSGTAATKQTAVNTIIAELLKAQTLTSIENAQVNPPTDGYVTDQSIDDRLDNMIRLLKI